MSYTGRAVPEGDMVPLEEEISCVRNIREEQIHEKNITRYSVFRIHEQNPLHAHDLRLSRRFSGREHRRPEMNALTADPHPALTV